MIIKRYIVNNMNEAMTRIRYELGKDAVIISQRKVRKPGIKGIFSSKLIEVTAAVENEVTTDEDNVKSSIEAIKKVVKRESSIKDSAPKVEKQDHKKQYVGGRYGDEGSYGEHNTYFRGSDNSIGLINEMKEMKIMLSELTNVNKPEYSEKSDIEKILEDNDVDSENIENILEKISSTEIDTGEIETNDYHKLKVVLKEMIHVTKPELQGRIVLVGPTGVGKTTTLAKLAGKLALTQKKKVGLITIDTYRIGAVEQLKTYADIMNIPFKVVYNMIDMDNAIEDMKDCEVILIDTTGRNSKNHMQMSELRTFVERADTKNINLVLSATTKNKDIKYIVEGYRILNYNSIIVTKLDETSTYGSIINILQTAKKPLSFVATGQNVPDDIKELSVDKIVSLILGEDTIC